MIRTKNILVGIYFYRVMRKDPRACQVESGAPGAFMHARERDVAPEPFLDFPSGHVQRAAAVLPKQGARAHWRQHRNYVLDLPALRLGKVADCMMTFARRGRD